MDFIFYIIIVLFVGLVFLNIRNINVNIGEILFFFSDGDVDDIWFFFGKFVKLQFMVQVCGGKFLGVFLRLWEIFLFGEAIA